ncbi:MAG: hypothetical protein RL038_914 [Actinomycetota bacterium]|jgi:hypothetical protein
MADNPKQHVVLACSNCNRETEHEVHYAGRILAHAKCLSCGTVMAQSTNELRKNYIKDLEHRIATKPSRLVRRILSDPKYLFTGMPRAIADQPKKFRDETRELREPDFDNSEVEGSDNPKPEDPGKE